MSRHKAVKISDDISNTDWQEELSFPDKYLAYQDKFINMFTQFESINNGQLGSIIVVQPRIELDEMDKRPIHSVPYRAGPEQREFGKKEIIKCLQSMVSKPHNRNGPHQLFLPGRKIESPLLRRVLQVERSGDPG